MRYHIGQQSRRFRRAQSGFTFIELTLVMGIVSLLLGGIWVAAGDVRDKTKVNKAGDELNQIYNNVRAYYASQNVSYNNLILKYPSNLNADPATTPASSLTTPGTDFCYYTPQMINEKIFPQEILTGGTIPENPWNVNMTYSCGASSIGSIQTALAGASGSPVDVVIRMINVPYNDCVRLLTNSSLPGPDTKLDKILVTWVNGITQTTTSYTTSGTTPCAMGGTCLLPPTLVDSNAGCNRGSGTLIMDFRYQLGG